MTFGGKTQSPIMYWLLIGNCDVLTTDVIGCYIKYLTKEDPSKTLVNKSFGMQSCKQQTLDIKKSLIDD